MNRPASITQHVWDGFSDEARAVVSALVEGFERRIAELEERLNRNSTNSSKPPSSDPIGVKRRPPAPPSKKRRGGQEGHPRRLRALVPPGRVTTVTDRKPSECRRCGHPLSGEDAEPRRHQVAKLRERLADCIWKGP
jgi:transposase